MPENNGVTRELNKIHNRKPNSKAYGFIFQKIICDYYNLQINDTANKYFKASYNEKYKYELIPVIKKIFKKVGSQPIELLTFTDRLTNTIEKTSPHNFLLKNGKTLSIKVVPENNKIPPKIVGQGGYDVLNKYFGDIYGKTIENQEDIKILMFNNIDEVLPIFIDYFFISNYTVLISVAELDDFEIVENNRIDYVSFSRDDFTFTKNISKWNVSTTLKYHDISIAEIEVLKNRTFIFRFIKSALNEFIQEFNNETLGISTEAAICEIFSLEKPESFSNRESRKYIKILKPILIEAFKNMPHAIDHSGSTQGERGGVSKCSYDFVLEGNLTLSVKTNKLNKNKPHMVCPPEVGQPGAETCFLYFSKFLPDGTKGITKKNFKQMVYEHIDELIPIYLSHLFDSDWLLWVYEVKDGYEHKEISRTEIMRYTLNYSWKKEKFTFTKQTIEDWTESNTLKYDGISLGNFQVHNHRNCFKFRFNMKNLLEIILK